MSPHPQNPGGGSNRRIPLCVMTTPHLHQPHCPLHSAMASGWVLSPHPQNPGDGSNRRIPLYDTDNTRIHPLHRSSLPRWPISGFGFHRGGPRAAFSGHVQLPTDLSVSRVSGGECATPRFVRTFHPDPPRPVRGHSHPSEPDSRTTSVMIVTVAPAPS